MMSSTDKTRVIILTGHYRIVGHISVLPEARVTDYICESKEFIAVTDAEVWDHEQRKVASSRFMMPEESVTQGLGLPSTHPVRK
jgi:hypothetical protein